MTEEDEEKKNKIENELKKLENQIYLLETDYFEEANSFGNIMIKGKKKNKKIKKKIRIGWI
jgi:hypothetical protein